MHALRMDTFMVKIAQVRCSEKMFCFENGMSFSFPCEVGLFEIIDYLMSPCIIIFVVTTGLLLTGRKTRTLHAQVYNCLQ